MPLPPRRASLLAVIGYAWDAEVFTATDVIETVAVTRSTAIDVIDELVARGLVVELPNARAVGDYRKGRPARRFALRQDAAFVVGLDAGRGHLTATVADLRGTTRAVERVVVDADDDAPDVRRREAERAVDRALRIAGVTRGDVAAMGVGVPAPVDARGESPADDAGFWTRMNPGFAPQFRQWVPMVKVANDASLASVAERTLGAARGCDDVVVLLAGERLGAGVWVDGHLLTGAHGGAGEMVAFDHVRGVDSAWGFGHRAVELAREAIARGTLPPSSVLHRSAPGELEGRDVFAAAAEGDPGARRITDEIGGSLAIIAGVFGSLFDTRLLIVSGAVADGAAPLIEAARGAVAATLHLPAPEIVASALGADIVSLGAVCAAVQEARRGILDLPQFAQPA
ncbi:ROK family protein [Microbacterium invictum]|uniref:ROK family protein n=1 Tax=Microbacterium invictum TaxID=515415 RepID=A0ABZ0VE34_9MICO|nr:ROK family protein [Microbacterium invictum]WQB71873.1 ROK family protein [Microbacterium invictum]